MEQKMFNFQTRGEKHRRLCAGSSPACEPGFTPVLILSLMVACFSLDMVYIQIMMEEDQKEGTPGSLQPFLSFCILFWASALYCQTGREFMGLCEAGKAGGISKAKAQMKRGIQVKLEQWAGRRQEQPQVPWVSEGDGPCTAAPLTQFLGEQRDLGMLMGDLGSLTEHWVHQL